MILDNQVCASHDSTEHCADSGAPKQCRRRRPVKRSCAEHCTDSGGCQQTRRESRNRRATAAQCIARKNRRAACHSRGCQAPKQIDVVTDTQVTARLNQLIQSFFRGNHAAYLAELKRQHTTEADVRDNLREQLVLERLYNNVTAGVHATRGCPRLLPCT